MYPRMQPRFLSVSRLATAVLLVGWPVAIQAQHEETAHEEPAHEAPAHEAETAHESDHGMHADRPGLVKTPFTIAPGTFQLESGVEFRREGVPAFRTRRWTTPTLFRIGVLPGFEIRAESNLFTRQRTVVGEENGVADVSAGVKVRLTTPHGARPGMAIIANATFASGAQNMRGQGVRPSARLAVEWELPSDFAIGVMPGVVFDQDPFGERFTSGMLGASLIRNWGGGFSTVLDAGLERIASRQNRYTEVVYAAGAAYVIGDRVRLDGMAGVGRNNQEAQIVVLGGLALAF